MVVVLRRTKISLLGVVAARKSGIRTLSMRERERLGHNVLLPTRIVCQDMSQCLLDKGLHVGKRRGTHPLHSVNLQHTIAPCRLPCVLFQGLILANRGLRSAPSSVPSCPLDLLDRTTYSTHWNLRTILSYLLETNTPIKLSNDSACLLFLLNDRS